MAGLQTDIQSNEFKPSGEKHICKRIIITNANSLDVRKERKTRAIELARTDRGSSPNRLWHDISNEIDAKH
ncbi:hypothetical protein HZS_1821 [Henneguya salminicola]|nr:hypothetical protein HZS_1821 [Henneguya salminicola]